MSVQINFIDTATVKIMIVGGWQKPLEVGGVLLVQCS